MIAEGTFRQDLYFRINTFPITVPPLREREGDLPLLIDSLLERVAPKRRLALSPAALRVLGAYPFPGNVRELRNVLERASLMCDGELIGPEHLPEEVLHPELAADEHYGLPIIGHRPPPGRQRSARPRRGAAPGCCARCGPTAAAAANWRSGSADQRAPLYRRLRDLGLLEGRSEAGEGGAEAGWLGRTCARLTVGMAVMLLTTDSVWQLRARHAGLNRPTRRGLLRPGTAIAY